MITVKIFKDREDKIRKYTIGGHANSGPYGQDIVCAAVSVLGQTILLSLGRVLGLEKDLKYKVDNMKGFLSCELPKNLDTLKLDQTQIVLETLLVGINSLIDSYPEYIKLEYGRCD